MTSAPSPDPTAPATPGAALAALWAKLRLLVVDVETLVAPDGQHRVIEAAVITCRGGAITAEWSERANPGHPVDEHTYRKHGITTDMLAGEGDFAGLEPELTRRLRGLDGEHVVVIAYNTSFDIPVLRREYRQLGQTLPSLPVLDAATLPRALGIRPASGSLADLLAELGVTNLAAHSARGDARATAQAVLLMLERAAEQGWRDFEALHAKAMDRRGRTTHSVRSPRSRALPAFGDDPDDDDLIELPAQHTSAHALVLTTTEPAELADWQNELEACGRLRCRLADDRVSVVRPDEVPTGVLLRTCEAVLDSLLTPPPPDPWSEAAPPVGELGPWRPDAPAVATVLAAVAPLLAALPDRRTALAWHDRWQPRLADLGRCDRDIKDEVACPSCRRGEGCALDTWPRTLAPAAFGLDLGKGAYKSFLHTTGKDTGNGVLVTWLRAKRRHLAEAVAWHVYEHHRTSGQVENARSFARLAWLAGAREPRLAAAYANLLSAPGDTTALQRGIDTCAEALLSRDGSTFDGWTELGAKHAQLLGRLERRRIRTTGELDDDGVPIPVRRHHPDAPRRSRPRRFSLEP